MIDKRLIQADINSGKSVHDILEKYNITIQEFYSSMEDIDTIPEEQFNKYINIAYARILMNITTIRELETALKSRNLLFPKDESDESELIKALNNL